MRENYRELVRGDESGDTTASAPESRLLMSIIIPAKDEANSIGRIISGIKQSLSAYPHEIIVVDDGSEDKTKEIAQDGETIVVCHKKNRGKGAAMQTGVAGGKGDIIVFLDGDGAHDPQDIPNIIAPILQNKADLVLGSRATRRSKVPISPLSRRLSNNLASFIISFTISVLLPLATLLNQLTHRTKQISKTKLPALDSEPSTNDYQERTKNPQATQQTGLKWVKITDCTTGFRAIRKESWEKLNLISQGFQIETEMIYEAARNKLAIVEIPINYNGNNGRSRLSITRDGLKTLTLLAGKLIAHIRGD